MPIYAILLGVSISFPLLFTVFIRDLIGDWSKFILSTTVVAIIFLIWDEAFTQQGVWGFNDDYCLGIYFLKMPIEEWLFFFIIPFCSLFIHFAIYSVYDKLKLNASYTVFFTLLFVLISLVLVIYYPANIYTLINYLFLIVVLITGLVFNKKLLGRFYISFIIILIPFFIVNGILTGSFISDPVVWYNENEFIGIRIGTVPMEDIGYAFSMLFGNLFLYKALGGRTVKFNS